jgi:SAM-dependent methyltransferase
MPNPAVALKEIWRLLKPNGALFVSVDIGGAPTPDEPTVLSVESLRELLREDFVTTHLTDGHRPHSEGRHFSVRVVAAKKPQVREQLDKKQLLHDYEVRIAGSESKTDLQNCASD